jgi:hypothetical protein
MQGKGTLIHCCWKCKVVHLLWKSVWSFLRKLKIELPYNATIPLLGIYLKECAPGMSHLHTHVHCRTITIAKLWKQSRCPTIDEWIK